MALIYSGTGSVNNRGQALVETLFTTVFLTVVVFAAVQLVIMVVNDLSMNESAFAISRVAVVSKTDDINSRLKSASAFLFLKDNNSSNLSFVTYDLPIDGRDVQGRHNGNKIKVYSTTVKYFQSVMFGSLINGSNSASLGYNNIIKNSARSWMIKSPDEEYYNKSYPASPNFK